MDHIKKLSFLVFKNSPYSIIVTDAKGKCIYANDSAARFFGVPRHQITRFYLHDLIHPPSSTNHERANCPVLSPLTTQQSLVRQQDTFYTISGSPIWVDYNSISIIEKKQVLGVYISFVNAIVAHGAQREYLSARGRFKAVFDSNIDPVFILDNRAYIIEANAAASHFMDKTDLVGQSFFSLFPPDYRFPVRNFWKSVRHNKLQRVLLKTRAPDKSEIFIEAVGRVNIQPGQNMVILRDITSQITTQQQRDQFAGLISHEIKNPLAVIKAYTQLLQREFTNDKSSLKYEYLHKIDDKVNFITQLINNMTDAIRLGTGQLSFYDELVDFDQQVKSIVAELQETNTTHKIIISGQTESKVMIDKHRLNQIIINLINNAVKYSPESDRVLVKLSKSDHQLKLQITDYGVGISTKNRTRLFRPFIRGTSSAVGKFPGLGLGLFITKSILSRYNGQLSLRSQPGKGSTFTVRLQEAN